MTMEHSPAIPAKAIVKPQSSPASGRTARQSDGKDFREVLKDSPDRIKSGGTKETPKREPIDQASDERRTTATEAGVSEPGHALQALSFAIWQLPQQPRQESQAGEKHRVDKLEETEARESAVKSMVHSSGQTDGGAETLTGAEARARKGRQLSGDRTGQVSLSPSTEREPAQGRLSPILTSSATESVTKPAVALTETGVSRQAERSFRKAPQAEEAGNSSRKLDARIDDKLDVQIIESKANARENYENAPGSRQDADPLAGLHQPAAVKGGVDPLTNPAQQISEKVSAAAAGIMHDIDKEKPISPVRQLVIRLHPEELGEVRVSLRMDRGRLSVSIEAVERTAADLLHRDRDMLEGLISAVVADGSAQQVTVTISEACDDPSDRNSLLGQDKSGLSSGNQEADTGRSSSRDTGDSPSGNEVGSGVIGDRETNHDAPSRDGRRLPGVIVV